MSEIHTCVESLLSIGVCCEPDCTRAATTAVLIDEADTFVEHARCADHSTGPDVLGTKPLVIDPVWAERTRRP